YGSIKLEFTLVQVLLQLLLVANVLPDLFLVQSDRAHAIATRPELPPEQRPFRSQHLAVDADGALALQVPHRHRDGILGRDADQHVDVVRHGFTFHQFHVLLPAQLPKDRADRFARPTEKLLLAVLWQDHNVVLALPLHVGLTLPIFHDGSPFAPRGLPQRRPSTATDAGTAEPIEFSPPEAVD